MQTAQGRRGRAPPPAVSLALADGCGDGVGGSRANAVGSKKKHQLPSDARQVQADATPQKLLETSNEKVESKGARDKFEKEERDEKYDDEYDDEDEGNGENLEIFTANEEIANYDEHGGNKAESAREEEDGDECPLEYRRRGSSSTSGGDEDDEEDEENGVGGGSAYRSAASEHSDNDGDEEHRDARSQTAAADGGCRSGSFGDPPSTDAAELNSHLPQPPLVAQIPTLQQQQQPPPRPSQVGYPTVCVSPGGLITVLLKYDVSVEMTLDRTLRVVNHRHKAVAASNARGSANCLFHVAAKVFQDGTRTEAEVFGERRCRMTTDGILFASGGECYLLDGDHIVPAAYCFSDMSRDCSVNILLAAAAAAASSQPQPQPAAVAADVAAGASAGVSVVAQCEQVAKSARYYFHKNGSTTVILNNVKVHQDERGDVQVTSGPKYICTSPVSGYILLRSHFVDMSAHANWFVSVRRGEHLLRASYTGFAVSNGRHEAGFDPYRAVFSRPFCEIITGPVPCSAGEISMGLPLVVLPQQPPPAPLVLLPTKPPPPQPQPPAPTPIVAAAPQSSATAAATGIRKMPNRSRFDRNRAQPIAPVAVVATTTTGSIKADSTVKGKSRGKAIG